MLTSKRVDGQVEYNDDEFAEIQTIGIETVGMRLGITTTTEIEDDRAREMPTGASRVGAGRN